MGTMEFEVGPFSVTTLPPVTPSSLEEIMVYRACSSASVVPGGFLDIAEAVCFLPPRDGMLHRISIRAACFERVGPTLQHQNCSTGITANLGFSEMIESSAGMTFNPLPNAPQTIENLPLTLADTNGNGMFLSAHLPHPIPFKEKVWTAVVITFPGCASKRAYISPCLDEYIHESDPSIVFKFQDWRGTPASKFGLVDHFVVSLN